jgi:NAD(P)-dependent dehydrogenase (short-subunit alcohol dehydrogenase family)
LVVQRRDRESICAVSSQHRVAVVTGAGSGIGRAVAQALLAAGWRVALVGRRDDALRETIEGSNPNASDALALAADVRDPDAVRSLFDRVQEAWGRVDLLFNNAGVFGATAPLDEVPTSSGERSSTPT